METDAVAIYKVSNADYCRLLVATTDDARGSLGKSLKDSEQQDLAESLRKQEVFVNKSSRKNFPAYSICHGDDLEYIPDGFKSSFERFPSIR